MERCVRLGRAKDVPLVVTYGKTREGQEHDQSAE
jgi:hypothetical protein